MFWIHEIDEHTGIVTEKALSSGSSMETNAAQMLNTVRSLINSGLRIISAETETLYLKIIDREGWTDNWRLAHDALDLGLTVERTSDNEAWIINF